MPGESREPLKFYRLWCGRKRYSSWKPTRWEAMASGIPHKVTFGDRGKVHMGPLAWLEIGERRYAKSRTISLGPDE